MWVAYTILVCAVYWVCECAPLAITSLIPIVVLPLAGNPAILSRRVSITNLFLIHSLTSSLRYVLPSHTGSMVL